MNKISILYRKIEIQHMYKEKYILPIMTTLYSLEKSNYESYIAELKSEEQYKKDILPAVMGCIYGASIGDASGVPYEVFGELMSELPQKTARPFVSLQYGYQSGTHKVPSGTWSDDTSMGLSLAMSMIKNEGFDQTKTTDWFVSWLTSATFSSMPYTWGVGNMTNTILRRYISTNNLDEAKESITSVPTNGCLMRNFPVACYYHDPKSLPDAIIVSQKQAEITNWGKECEVAIVMCCLQTEIIWKCIHNHLQLDENKKTINDIIMETLAPHLETNNPHITALYDYVYNKKVTDITPKIYVGSSFTAMSYALYGLRILDMSFSDNPYMHGLEEVIKLGGDTDTNGCIYGAMAGAYVGFKELPSNLVKNIVYSNFLSSMALSLVLHEDKVTGKFITNYHNKFKENSAPKFVLEKSGRKIYGISSYVSSPYVKMEEK